MKLLALTPLVLAVLTYASPAPAAGPLQTEAIEQCHDALAARNANTANAAHHAYLVERGSKKKDKKKKKKSKPKKPKGIGNLTEESTAPSFAVSSRALQVGAVGLGVLEVVRLWG